MTAVLACVDLTDRDAAVLRAADALALLTGATVHALHVAAGEPAFMGYDPPGGVHDPADHAVAVEHERVHLDALVEQIAMRSPTEVLVVAGPTVDAILEIAAGLDAGTIVVGRGAHGGLIDRVLGSVATDLVRRARTPVLVVPIGD